MAVPEAVRPRPTGSVANVQNLGTNSRAHCSRLGLLALCIPCQLVILASHACQMRHHVSIGLALRKLAATVRLPTVVLEAIATRE